MHKNSSIYFNKIENAKCKWVKTRVWCLQEINNANICNNSQTLLSLRCNAVLRILTIWTRGYTLIQLPPSPTLPFLWHQAANRIVQYFTIKSYKGWFLSLLGHKSANCESNVNWSTDLSLRNFKNGPKKVNILINRSQNFPNQILNFCEK